MSNQTCRWCDILFFIHSQAGQWSDVGGVYIFAGKNAQGNWVAYYAGKARSFAERIPFHERWEAAARAGATHVHATVVSTETGRANLEASVIAKYQPRMNTQLRSGGVR